MKLHAQSGHGLHTVTAYGDRFAAVNGSRLEGSFIVTPERLIADWPVRSIDDLDAAALAPLAELGCSIVLLGTGARQRFPAPALLRTLYERRIGVEIMDSGAACRTYNILAAEGRPVAAAVILEAAA